MKTNTITVKDVDATTLLSAAEKVLDRCAYINRKAKVSLFYFGHGKVELIANDTASVITLAAVIANVRVIEMSEVEIYLSSTDSESGLRCRLDIVLAADNDE